MKGSEERLHSLAFRMMAPLAAVLVVCITLWGVLLIDHRKQRVVALAVEEADRWSRIVTRSTHEAIELDPRRDINRNLRELGVPADFVQLRRFYKQDQVAFATLPDGADQGFRSTDQTCRACHAQDPPLATVGLAQRLRVSSSSAGDRLVTIVTPVYNEAGCSSKACHVHPQDKKLLGIQETVISLQARDANEDALLGWLLALVAISLAASAILVSRFFASAVDRPIQELVRRLKLLSQGQYDQAPDQSGSSDLHPLANAVEELGATIAQREAELHRQLAECQQLFERVPCFITVQDKELRLVKYNQAFAEQFDPRPGAFCYEVYKGRTAKCDPCPVINTFEDGESHSSEELGITRDDPICYRIVQTSAIKDGQGEITGVMQMSVDITRMKRMEEKIRKSEEEYRSIFNNIPVPVFVLDRKSLKVLDCNDSVKDVYGFTKEEILQSSFLNLFEDAEHQNYALELRNSDTLNHARQVTRDGRSIFVNIRVSPYEYMGREALLVTTSDVIRMLMVKQQLIQVSKMATLGEMATGVAHELNQPLSVIKTASSFLQNKFTKGEKPRDSVLQSMVAEIDGHVDRASGIINHLREFGRKSEATREKIQVNAPLRRALEIFSQQLKLRQIEVVSEFGADLPPIMADANRLEQVFINLLINARDAIEEKHERSGDVTATQRISVKTSVQQDKVRVEVTDTGIGIPEVLLDRIFEPFFTTKQIGRGTGLGLSISYGIVQDYHGTIEVKTAENEGSTFIIQFPIQVNSDG
jgi:histidine kinase